MKDKEPSDQSSGLEGRVEERGVRYGLTEKSPSRTRPLETAHLYPFGDESAGSNNPDEKVETETNPLADPSEVEQGTKSNEVPSPATSVLESESGEEALIPLSGVN